VTFALLLQGIEPKDYPSSWGVLGALVFVILTLCGVVYAVFIKGAAETAKRTEAFLEFTDRHTQLHIKALGDLGTKIEQGDSRLAQAFEANSKLTRSVLVMQEAMARARATKAGGGALSAVEVDAITRAAYDSVTRGSGS